MEVAFEDWMLAAAFLILGAALGWLLRGALSSSGGKAGGAADGASPSPAGSPAAPAPADAPAASPGAKAGALSASDHDRIGGIERELSEARALLDEGEQEFRVFDEEMAELEGTIQRAGARLRAIFREIRLRARAAEINDGDD